MDTKGKIRKWVNDIFTEDDGDAICVAKVMSMIAFLSYLAYAGYGLHLNKAPDLNNFANGLMMVLVGCGSIIAGKQITQKTIPAASEDKKA